MCAFLGGRVVARPRAQSVKRSREKGNDWATLRPLMDPSWTGRFGDANTRKLIGIGFIVAAAYVLAAKLGFRVAPGRTCHFGCGFHCHWKQH
jgi:hypothetical protein